MPKLNRRRALTLLLATILVMSALSVSAATPVEDRMPQAEPEVVEFEAVEVDGIDLSFDDWDGEAVLNGENNYSLDHNDRLNLRLHLEAITSLVFRIEVDQDYVDLGATGATAYIWQSTGQAVKWEEESGISTPIFYQNRDYPLRLLAGDVRINLGQSSCDWAFPVRLVITDGGSTPTPSLTPSPTETQTSTLSPTASPTAGPTSTIDPNAVNNVSIPLIHKDSGPTAIPSPTATPTPVTTDEVLRPGDVILETGWHYVQDPILLHTLEEDTMAHVDKYPEGASGSKTRYGLYHPSSNMLKLNGAYWVKIIIYGDAQVVIESPEANPVGIGGQPVPGTRYILTENVRVQLTSPNGSGIVKFIGYDPQQADGYLQRSVVFTAYANGNCDTDRCEILGGITFFPEISNDPNATVEFVEPRPF